MLKLLPLLFVFACAHQPTFEYDSNYTVWMNKNADDVLTHPIFATMPMQTRETEGGLKMYSFRNFGGYSSLSNCSGGGWSATCDTAHNEVTCNHLFTISKNTVINYQRVGDCANEQLKFRPYKDGEPELTERELQHFGSRGLASGPREKQCGLLGKIFGC